MAGWYLSYIRRQVREFTPPPRYVGVGEAAHPCDRFLAYRLEGREAQPWVSPALQARFDEALFEERALEEALVAAGFRVLARSPEYRLPGRRLVMHPDFVVESPSTGRMWVEAKTIKDWVAWHARTPDRLRRAAWWIYRSWYVKAVLYAALSRVPCVLWIVPRPNPYEERRFLFMPPEGQAPADDWMQANVDAIVSAEEVSAEAATWLQRLRRIRATGVEGATRTDDWRLCERCPFVAECRPEMRLPGEAVLPDEAAELGLDGLLDEWVQLRPQGERWVELDREVRDRIRSWLEAKGRDRLHYIAPGGTQIRAWAVRYVRPAYTVEAKEIINYRIRIQSTEDNHGGNQDDDKGGGPASGVEP